MTLAPTRSAASSDVDRMMSQRRSLRPGRPKPAGVRPMVTSQGGQQGITGRGGNFQAFGPAAQRRLAAGQAVPQLQGGGPPMRGPGGPPPVAGMNGGGMQAQPMPPIAIDGVPPPGAPPGMNKPMGGPPPGPGGPMDDMGFMQRMGGQLPPELMARLQALRAGSQGSGNYPQVGGAGMPPPQGAPSGGMMPPSALPGISAPQPGMPPQGGPGLDAYWRSPNARAF